MNRFHLISMSSHHPSYSDHRHRIVKSTALATACFAAEAICEVVHLWLHSHQNLRLNIPVNHCFEEYNSCRACDSGNEAFGKEVCV